MRILQTLVCVFLASAVGFAAGLPKASDFKDIGSGDSATDKTTSKTSDKADKVDTDKKDGVDGDESKPNLKDNEEVLSGTVHIMRKAGQTEVFFKDLKESYYIPSGNNHNAIFKACETSQNKGTKMSFKANTKTRQILSLQNGVKTQDPNRTKILGDEDGTK